MHKILKINNKIQNAKTVYKNSRKRRKPPTDMFLSNGVFQGNCRQPPSRIRLDCE